MATTSTAHTHWEGALTDGAGTVDLRTSGAATFDVRWSARAEAGQGTTNPEELIAAALSTCYSMALSHALAGKGTPPASLDTTVDVSFQPGVGITGAHVTVVGSVPGITADDFRAAADDTLDNCPVSKALAGIKKTLDVEFR